MYKQSLHVHVGRRILLELQLCVYNKHFTGCLCLAVFLMYATFDVEIGGSITLAISLTTKFTFTCLSGYVLLCIPGFNSASPVSSVGRALA